MATLSDGGKAAGRRVRMSAEQRRATIIAASRSMFAERGYHATGTADIAAAVGCSEALLYRHFPSKQALLLAVVEEGAAIAEERLYVPIAEAEDPFGALCDRWAELLEDREYLNVLRVRARAATISQDDELRRALGLIRERFRARIAAAIAASRERGFVRPDVDVDDLGRLYGGLTFAVAFARAVEGSDEVAALGGAARTLAAIVRPSAASGR